MLTNLKEVTYFASLAVLGLPKRKNQVRFDETIVNDGKMHSNHEDALQPQKPLTKWYYISALNKLCNEP